MKLVTGNIVQGLPKNFTELGLLDPIPVNLEKYQMTDVDIFIYRNHKNAVISSLMILNDGTEVRTKGNILNNNDIVLRDIDYCITKTKTKPKQKPKI